MRNDDQDIERLIDTALAGYSSAEPRFGLEQRVINRIREGSKRQSFPWRRTAAVMGACFLVLAAALWVPRSAEPLHPKAPVVYSAEKKVVLPVKLEYPESAKVRRPLRRPRRHDPALPTEQERALLTLVRYSPEALKALRSQDRPIVIEPITIAAIEIQPLQSGGDD